MKLSLPSKLTLGKKPKVEEEIKNDDGSGPDSPKYSSAEVKLAVIAIEVSKHIPTKIDDYSRTFTRTDSKMAGSLYSDSPTK